MLKDPENITLLDIYRAVHLADEDHLFDIHNTPSLNCLVGRNIEQVLQYELKEAQEAMENRLTQTTLGHQPLQFIERPYRLLR